MRAHVYWNGERKVWSLRDGRVVGYAGQVLLNCCYFRTWGDRRHHYVVGDVLSVSDLVRLPWLAKPLPLDDPKVTKQLAGEGLVLVTCDEFKGFDKTSAVRVFLTSEDERPLIFASVDPSFRSATNFA